MSRMDIRDYDNDYSSQKGEFSLFSYMIKSSIINETNL